MVPEPLELLKKTLLSPGDENLIGELQAQAVDVVQTLEDQDLDLSDSEIDRLDRHAEWVARVYQTLAGTEEVSSSDKEVVQALEEIRNREDQEMARAFSGAVETLPEEFHDWSRWFGQVPPAAEDYQKYLREQVVVKEAAHAEELLRYGLTPATFVEASRGVELLTDRLIRTALGTKQRYPDDPQLLQLMHWIRALRDSGDLPAVEIDAEEGPAGEEPSIPRELLLGQIVGTSHCAVEAAPPLLGWMMEVAHLKPFFFGGYQTCPVAKQRIRLIQDPTGSKKELMWRWGKPAAEVEPETCKSFEMA